MLGPIDKVVDTSLSITVLTKAMDKAIEEGYIDEVKKLLQKGYDVHAHDDNAIRWASQHRNNKIVELLLDYGADINANNGEVLDNAVDQKHISMIDMLIERGVNVNIGCSIIYASGHGCIDIVKRLVESGVNIHIENECPLHMALKYGYIEIAKYLIDIGADVKVLKSKVLVDMVKYGNLKTIQYLIDEIGIDMSKAYNKALFSLIMSEKNNVDIIKFLIKKGANPKNSLFQLAGYGKLKQIKLLVECGADVNIDDGNPLTEASKYGHFDVVKYLVENGADVHAQDDSALCDASYNGDVSIVKYLVEKGADIHAKNNYSLCWAAAHNNRIIVDFLLEKGADINAGENSALKLASINGHVDMVKYLIDIGAEINSDVIYSSIILGRLKITKYLMSKKSENVNIDIHYGNDKMLYALIFNGKLSMIKYLFNIGTYDIDTLNKCAMSVYLENNGVDISRFLIEKGADYNLLSRKIKLKLGYDVNNWSKKPDDVPSFKKLSECPISQNKLTDDVEQIGCSACLNVFEKQSLEEWLDVGNECCPMCRTGMIFYKV